MTGRDDALRLLTMAVVEGYRRPTGRRSSPRRRPTEHVFLPTKRFRLLAFDAILPACTMERAGAGSQE